MVACAIAGCHTRSDRRRAGISLFSVPKVVTREGIAHEKLTRKRRLLWLARINRRDLNEHNVKPWTQVCGRHFITGSPSKLYDESNLDWAPSRNLGYRLTCTTQKKADTNSSNSNSASDELKPDETTVDHQLEENDLIPYRESLPFIAMLLCDASTQTDITKNDFENMENECKNLRTELFMLRKKKSSVKSSEHSDHDVNEQPDITANDINNIEKECDNP